MERRAGARGRARGGDDISQARESRGRLGTALASLALLAGLVAYPAAAGDRLALFVALVGIAGWLLAGLALLIRRPLLLAWGLAAVGAEYATFLRLRGGSVDSRAALVALLADLLLVASGSASAGLALEAIGVGAAVFAVAIVVRLAAR
ncbi:MAG: hypothetical protein E6G32_14800 [Actinobacteria bacterium]|nr:MAG: hypothetical protein E6G32_14800 [Actinomycetota bacterium]